MSTAPAATISVDVDPVDLHLVGYGLRGLEPDPLVYERALPRLLDGFAGAGVRATFFFVARDAPQQAVAIRRVADAGHEVASHSVSHPMSFARLPRPQLREELRVSRERLEQASGGPVIGFRAPNWDLDSAAACELVDTGYRYDASGYPTPLLLPARLALALKSADRREALRLRFQPFSWKRVPHEWRRGERALREYPVSVTPVLRFPIYHTAGYLLAPGRVERMIAAIARRAEPLSYPLHGVDVLGLAEDGVDARLAGHPGMDRTLGQKLALLASILGVIAERFVPRTFAERLLGDPLPSSL